DQLTRVAKLHDLTAQARMNATALAVETRDAALALELLGTATTSNSAETLLVAQVNWMNSRVAQAQAAFQKLLDSPDPEPEALELAAEFYFSRDDSTSAAKLLDRLAADKRYPGRAQYQLGRYSLKMSDAPKALEHFKLALAADPMLGAAWSELIG